jgi:hypothetical protein
MARTGAWRSTLGTSKPGMEMALVNRHELREYTAAAFRSGGAMRSDLLMAAIQSAARQEVIDTLLGLTEGYYATFDEVWRQLSKEDQG